MEIGLGTLFCATFPRGVFCDAQKTGSTLWLPQSSWMSPHYKIQKKSCFISLSLFDGLAFGHRGGPSFRGFPPKHMHIIGVT